MLRFIKVIERIALALLLVSSFLMGCGEEEPSFSLLADTDVFFQDLNKNSINGKVDIMWVIDNSGSMQTSQQNVADNFQSFINEFQNKGFDFRIAVTTTEAYKAFYTGNGNWARFRDGTNATGHSGIFVIDPNTPDLTNVFLLNMLQGTSGSGNERAFQSLRETLSLPENQGFPREDSFLSVIIVSDEDDFSRDSSSNTNNYNASDIHPVQEYVDYLDQLTRVQAGLRRYSVSAVAIFDEDCRTLLNQSWNGRKIGIRYGELVDITGGVKGSLCGDFANTLDLVSENILSLATQFYLSRVPIVSSLSIRINEQNVPKLEENSGPLSGGWSYLSETNSIAFYGDYIPEAGAKIQVDFDPLNYAP